MKKWNASRRVAITAFLIAVMIVASACQTVSTDTTRPSTIITPSTSGLEPSIKPDYLSAYALAQKVAEAINDQGQTAVIYQSIPDKQRPEIMLDDFVRYIALLRRGASGTVTTLTRISQDEMAKLFSDLRYAKTLRHVGFYFDCQLVGKPAEKTAFFLQQMDDGMPYLDKGPIAKALAMQNFAALYFDAIDRYDRDALSVLVRIQSEAREPRLMKADRILAFYRSVVATASPSFHVDLLMPDRIVYSQQIYIDANKSLISSRTMTIFADGETGFWIDDSIPDQLDVKDLQIMMLDKVMIDLSKLLRESLPQVANTQVTPILGQPFLHDDTTCTVIEGNTRAMTASYFGLIVEGVGRCEKHQTWKVDLKSATLTGPAVSLGSGIAVGDSLDKLLILHPFIGETDFQLERIVGKYRMVARFDISNQKITRIKLTVTNV